jgi:hypothetical protein
MDQSSRTDPDVSSHHGSQRQFDEIAGDQFRRQYNLPRAIPLDRRIQGETRFEGRRCSLSSSFVTPWRRINGERRTESINDNLRVCPKKCAITGDSGSGIGTTALLFVVFGLEEKQFFINTAARYKFVVSPFLFNSSFRKDNNATSHPNG